VDVVNDSVADGGESTVDVDAGGGVEGFVESAVGGGVEVEDESFCDDS
jgi:hypothetical protein